MNCNEVFLLGVKNRVAAISRLDGHIFWSTELSGRMGAGYVSVACDGVRVFAYAVGHLHCLELASGRILWTNELHGYGYGFASVTLPGGSSTSDIAAVQHASDETATCATAPMTA
jgi:hypothetical protein